jgi:hypothetical protein
MSALQPALVPKEPVLPPAIIVGAADRVKVGKQKSLFAQFAVHIKGQP